MSDSARNERKEVSIMEELKNQISALEKNADCLWKFLASYYNNQANMTHGMWEDHMKLSALQAQIVDLKLKLAALQEKA